MKKLLTFILAAIIVLSAVPMSHARVDWRTVLDIPNVTDERPFTDVYGVTQTWITVDASSITVTLLTDAGQFDLGGSCWSVYEDEGKYFLDAGYDPECTEDYVTGAGGSLYRRAGAQYILSVPGLYIFDTTDVENCVFVELTGNGGAADSTGNTDSSVDTGLAIGTPGDDPMYPTDYYGRRLALNMPYYSIESLTTAYRHMYCQATDHYVVEAGTQVNAPEGVYFTYVDYGWYSAGSFNTDWDEVNDTVWTLSDPDVSYTLLMSDGSFISFYASRNGIINNSGNTYDENATGAGGRFMDVTPDAYYHDPVEWAVEKGITVGTSDTTFSPDTECTRGQILTFLWRAAGCPPHYMGSSPITDIAVTDYYYDAVLWAYANGILDTKFGFADPNAPCTRAMTVQFLWLFGGAQYMEDAAPFTDVPASADYAMAVAWALENGITAGTSETTFSPGSTCTRGQIVTFLWRSLVGSMG